MDKRPPVGRLLGRAVLCWLVGRFVCVINQLLAEAALHDGPLLKASDVLRSSRTAACLDSNVCLKAIQKYCEVPAWHAGQQIADALLKDDV